jgi:pantoate--beta-alanine ligase
MKVIKTAAALTRVLKPIWKKNKKIGFIPTMGYFHEAHLTLMRRARKECDVVVVSLFVNPLQFSPNEDLARYPKNLKRDVQMAESTKIDYLFVPSVRQFYKPDHQSRVTVERLTGPLCGAGRPGHFRGVSTVVATLFNLIQPTVAYFGQKDFQQVRIIQQMAEDLAYNIKVKIMPIVREKDGLAMSSRNAYLKPSEREQAAGIWRSLKEVRRQFKGGQRKTRVLESLLKKELRSTFPKGQVEYAEIRDVRRLHKSPIIQGKAFAAVAVRVGKTRLIDNVLLGD